MNKIKAAKGYKIGNCAHCMREFEYPKHLEPRPVYCEQHDPAPTEQVEFDDQAYVKPVPRIAFPQPIIDDSYPSGNYDGLKRIEDFRKNSILNNPNGNYFHNSPGLKTAAQIRQEYMMRIEEAQCPIVTPIELPLPTKSSSVGIWHVGDVHVGTDACTYKAFKQVLNYIEETPDEYVAFQGDLVDFLTGVSVGIMAEQSMSIQDQITLVTDDLLPLAKKRKILWMVRGNHEDRLDKATKNIVDVMQTMARRLDVQYLRTEGWTKVESGGVSYMGYNIHGFNSGRTPASLLTNMRNFLKSFPSADLITCGHNHCQGVVDLTTEEFNQTTMRPEVRTRYGLYTSTFHSYQGYARDAGFTPGPLGCGRVEFNIEHNTLAPAIVPIVRRGSEYHAVLPSSK